MSLTTSAKQNFVCTMVESQFADGPSSRKNFRYNLSVLLNRFNSAFVCLFTVELAINAFANWFWPFVQDFWNSLDASLILLSVASALAPDQSPALASVLRAVRVIRVIGKIRALRKVVTALGTALLPVLSVFFILFLLMGVGERLSGSLPTRPRPARPRADAREAAGAVVGVAVFGEAVPEYFSAFDVSFFTLFLITAGEPWPEAMPRRHEDGSANYVVMAFVGCYTVVTFWLILQVGPPAGAMR